MHLIVVQQTSNFEHISIQPKVCAWFCVNQVGGYRLGQEIPKKCLTLLLQDKTTGTILGFSYTIGQKHEPPILQLCFVFCITLAVKHTYITVYNLFGLNNLGPKGKELLATSRSIVQKSQKLQYSCKYLGIGLPLDQFMS